MKPYKNERSTRFEHILCNLTASFPLYEISLPHSLTGSAFGDVCRSYPPERRGNYGDLYLGTDL